MKKNYLITIISVALLIMALVGTLFIDGKIGSRISTIVTIVTAIIGAVALFIQFKKDKEVNQANFIFQFAKEFRSSNGNDEITDLLEKARKDPKTDIEFEKRYSDYITYLQWIETLASLVIRRVTSIEAIDDLLSYNIFIALNNKEIQDKGTCAI